MTPSRRAVLPLLALPLLAQGKPPLRVRPRPGTAALGVRAGPDPAAIAPSAFEVRLIGRGAPSDVVRMESWYGRGRLLGTVSVAGRDLLLIATEGTRGTGVYQEWLVIAGCDDAGVLRVLGIEVLSCREVQGLSGEARLTGGVVARDVGLRVTYQSNRILPLPRREGRPPRMAAPARERWSTFLPWSGAGALPAPASVTTAGPMQRQADATRARVAALLASPVSDLIAIRPGLQEAGLYELGALYPATEPG
ncbi:hypothetical protein [Muricoccus radiodurans]|uniref:hypothetical protein n=1 Tax=Muricoccus radiodurans TaxID=2231721 RepID=UPI003CFA6718